MHTLSQFPWLQLIKNDVQNWGPKRVATSIWCIGPFLVSSDLNLAAKFLFPSLYCFLLHNIDYDSCLTSVLHNWGPKRVTTFPWCTHIGPFLVFSGLKINAIIVILALYAYFITMSLRWSLIEYAGNTVFLCSGCLVTPLCSTLIISPCWITWLQNLSGHLVVLNTQLLHVPQLWIELTIGLTNTIS